jgi:multidrug efflux pump
MAFTDIFIKRPILAGVVSTLILLVGLVAAFNLPIRQFPVLTNTQIIVTTAYPGASPDLIGGFITQPIEQAVAAADGVDYVISSSTQGVSVVTVNVRLNFNPNQALTEVMSKVNSVKYLIPREANDPVIVKQVGGQQIAVMYLGFSSTELTSSAVSDYLTRVVQPVLATVDGVASAEVIGGQTFAMRLWLDPVRMAGRGVSPDDVSNAIRANNFQSAAGTQKGYFTVANVSTNTGVTDVEQFKRLVVKEKDGGFVRMEDVATVDLGAQSADSSVALNGQRAVFIGINATPLGNPLTIVKGVRAQLPALEKTLPPAIKMQVAYDSTRFIESSIDEVRSTLIEAVLIVVVVIFLFLASLRSVFIPVVTIPLSLIGVCTLMLAMGFSFNLLTLLAMVLAIGLVVDDAIVVVENIHRHLEEGKTAVQASLIGAREIVTPVISMTITLAAVYAPIGFLGGVTGTLFKEFAFTLAAAVIVSGVIALTLSPAMCSLLLKEGDEGRFAKFVNRIFQSTANWYGRKLDRSLEYRPVTTMFAVVILGLVAFLYTHTSKELAPEEDQGFFFAINKAPKYANIDYMNFYTDKLDKALAQIPEADLRFMINGVPTSNQGFAGMTLKPWDERKRTAKQVNQADLQGALRKIEGVNVAAFPPPALPGGSGGLPVQLVISTTGNFQSIYEEMTRIRTEARKSGLFIFTDVDLDFNQPVVKVNIDRQKANDLGIQMSQIGSTLSTLLGGNFVNRFNLAGRSYQVIPQVPRDLRITPESLNGYYVPTAGGRQIPISTVVSIEHGTDPNALTKYNQLNSATFGAVPIPGVTMGTVVDWLKGQASQLPSGFRFDFLSDSRQYEREGNQLAFAFGFALLVIYLVLAAQFESLRDPLVILISVPMAISGALLPLFFGLATINIYTQVGLLTLVGLISKHGILMVEFAKELQLNEGLDKREAIEHSARVRLRPILMTTAAMVVGLIPLLMATGAGAASRFSIGLVIVSGMSIGTLFTLFVLPAIYVMIATDHKATTATDRAKDIRDFDKEFAAGRA